MKTRNVAISLAVSCAIGCAERTSPAPDRPAEPPARPARRPLVPKKPIGIKTAGDVFEFPLMPEGQSLPCTRSETFTNKTDGGANVPVEISQKGSSGIETIASLIIAIPPVADNALQITVTLKVSEDRQLRVKTTATEAHSVQEFGPFPVE